MTAPKSCHSGLYVPPPADTDRIGHVIATDEQVRRVAFIAGLMPGVPRGPGPLGAGAPIPDRTEKHGNSTREVTPQGRNDRRGWR